MSTKIDPRAVRELYAIAMHNVLIVFRNFYFWLYFFMYVLNLLVGVSRNPNSVWFLL